MKPLYKFLAGSLLTIAIMHGLAGCATTAPRTPEYFAQQVKSIMPEMHKIGLVTSLSTPQIGEIELGISKGEAITRGTLGGAMEGVAAVSADIGSCSGSFCGAASVIILSIFVLVGAITGAITGSEAGTSIDLLSLTEENARQMLAASDLQTQLTKRVQAYARNNLELEVVHIQHADISRLAGESDYKTFAHDSIDAILEVELLRFSMEYALQIDAKARLVSTKTGKVLNESQYRFLSERHRPVEWVNNGTATLTETIDAGLRTLAEDIIDENFLLFYPQEPVKKPVQAKADAADNDFTDDSVPHYVLAPVYPEIKTCFFCKHGHALGNMDFVEVNSVTPTLRWESFPREYDLLDSQGNQQNITSVSYDLRIFDEGIGFLTPPKFVMPTLSLSAPGELLYYERDIPTPYHKVEDVLNPCTNYFWTVRARFKLEGKPRITEWAGAFDIGGWSSRPWNLRRGVEEYKLGSVPDRPEMFYYPFRTPCEPKN